MAGIKLELNKEGAFADLKGKIEANQVYHTDAPFTIAVVEHEAALGAPTLILRFDFPDGRTFLQETSVPEFMAAADAVRARFGL